MSNKKIKILTLSDHPLSPSGVGTQTNYILQGLLKTGKYQIISLGGAIKHQDYRPAKFQEYGDDFVIIPVDGYDGIVIERNIPLTSMCSHHHQTIGGVVHVGYIVGENGSVIGLSKLNRIIEHFGRRGAIQEQLTSAIHQAVDKICENNGVIGVPKPPINRYCGVFFLIRLLRPQTLLRQQNP